MKLLKLLPKILKIFLGFNTQKTPFYILYFLFFSFYLLAVLREVAEWSKAHAWKVCIHQKCIEGSNPFLSAEYVIYVIYFYIFNTLKY